MKQIIITSLFLLSTWAPSGSAAQQVNAASVVGGEVRPTVSVLALSSSTVTDLHLRPMFTTTIRLPEAVTSVAVGAPTLFEVEHSDQEPRLVFVKPSTKDAATSNLIIALQSGHEISIRLISEGAAGTAPVDFVVNYQPQQSFLIGSADPVVNQEEAIAKTSSKQKEIPVIDRKRRIDRQRPAQPVYRLDSSSGPCRVHVPDDIGEGLPHEEKPPQSEA